MTKKIMLSTVAVSMISSMAVAGTLTLQGTPYTIAQEVVRGGVMPSQELNVTRLMRNAEYTSAIPNGGSVNDPSFTLGLSKADLVVPAEYEQNHIPAICYPDPTTNNPGRQTAIAVYDHTAKIDNGPDQLIFRSFSSGDAVSDNNVYTLMEVPNEGNLTCAAPTWEMYATSVADCDPQNDADLALWDANNVQDERAVDTATDSDIFEVVREFTISLAAKTFGEIKVSEWVDVRNGEAPIVDHAHRSPNQDDDTTVADIHTNAPDTALAYFLVPHNAGYWYDGGQTLYNYYYDLMDLPQQADPIAWYISITPDLDYSVQDDANTNTWSMETQYDGLEPGNIPNWDHEVLVSSWWTDAGSLVMGDDCDQGPHDLSCVQSMPKSSGNEYFGVAWYGGLQNQTQQPINPTNFTSTVAFKSSKTNSSGIQVWPFESSDISNCVAPLPAADTGYWQYAGYHAVIPGIANDERKSTVIKIYNGLIQSPNDRDLSTLTYVQPVTNLPLNNDNREGIVGWNDETNIARTADVYFRVITDNGEVKTVFAPEWQVAPNSALTVRAQDILTKADLSTDNSVKVEVFVNNDPKNINVYAVQLKRDGTDSRVLPVDEVDETNNLID